MISDPAALFGHSAARDALRRQAETYVAQAMVAMRRAQLLVEHDRVDTARLLTARRHALGSHFGRYQRFKHGSIFDPVVRHGPASSRVVARTMKVDCVELGEVFGAYTARWRDLRAADWPAYRRDMLTTVDMLTINLQAELRAIRQLLMISDLYAV